MPERDIESLGVMGKGAGGGQEILPPPSPSAPSPPLPPIKYENPKSSYLFLENRSYFVAIPSKMREKQKQKFKISDLDLRIARIDPSRQVSMGEPCQNENEFTGIVNIAF